MGYNVADALQALQSLQANGPVSQEALLNLVKQVNVDDATGNVTVLWSGFGDVAEQMTNDPSTRVIGKTSAAKFIESREFREALAATIGMDFDDWINPNIVTAEKTALQNWLYHGTDGPWADASKRFVEATTGEVRIMTLAPREDSVLMQTDLKAAA